MAHGKTLELIKFDSMMRYRKTKPADKVNRDRSLNGKARIRARRAS